MAYQLTPPMYARGNYRLKSPFKVDEAAVYTTNAIRSFAECELKGLRVYDEVYKPKGIDEATYLADARAGINIVALFSDNGPDIYVPDSYIISYPNMGEAIPQRLLLSVDLGFITSHWNDAYLLNAISDICSDVVGGSPKVKIHVVPITGMPSNDDVKALEALRTDAVQTRTTDYAKNKELSNTNALLNDKVKSLENKLRSQV